MPRWARPISCATLSPKKSRQDVRSRYIKGSLPKNPTATPRGFKGFLVACGDLSL